MPSRLWPLGIGIVSLVWLISTEKALPLSIAAFGLCLGLIIPLFREIEWDGAVTISRLVARYSYGVYLAHFPIMLYILRRPNPGQPRFKYIHSLPQIRHFRRPLNLILVLALTGIASYVLYHYIEKPGIQLGRAMAKRLTASKDVQESADILSIRS
jgi:peptidoglycan/LPS O-acetylase OafA/YrhL